MADATKEATKDATSGATKPVRWRPWLRAVHRDIGYVAVGLTFIYALSGLAVNHITDWSDGDASFKTYSVTLELGAGLGASAPGASAPGSSAPGASAPSADAAAVDAAVADLVRKRLAIAEAPREVYRQSPEELEILFDKRTLHVNTATGRVIDEGQKPRFLLRVANWLHLNRGKKAWTYVADAYAGGLLLLAVSGMFMIAGRKGLLGRGAVLVGVGIAIPVLYVTLAGP